MRHYILYLTLFPLVVGFAGCAGFAETVGVAADAFDDPAVKAKILEMEQQVSNGNWVGAGFAALGGVAIWVGKWMHGRVKNSEAGEFFGGSKAKSSS